MPTRPGRHRPAHPVTARHQPQTEQWGKGRGGRPWERTRKRIFERDCYLCQICLEHGRLTAVELHGPKHGVCDHKVPKARGGSDGDDNLWTICQPCDKAKTAREGYAGRRGGSKV